MQPERQWLFSCGHTVPLLEHDRPGVLPSRPRMCERCGRLREVEAPATSTGEIVCVECGARSVDGRGWRAEIAPDDTGVDEAEVPVYCPNCWEQEFGEYDLG